MSPRAYYAAAGRDRQPFPRGRGRGVDQRRRAAAGGGPLRILAKDGGGGVPKAATIYSKAVGPTMWAAIGGSQIGYDVAALHADS